jgi:DNA-binding FadR family transcriptional regulator
MNDNARLPPKAAILVARRIVGDVAAAGLVPGDRLAPEHIMVAEYGVARATLREALRFLELQGVVELRRGPQGGPVLRRPDAYSLETVRLLLQFTGTPFRDIVEAREGIEPMLAQLAAQRMSAVELAEVRSSVEAMEAGLDDRSTFLDSNQRFHNAIAHGSGNAVFGYLIDALLALLDGSAMGITYPERQRVAVLQAHKRIYAALAARDGTASASAMRAHIDEYARNARRRFPATLDRPILWADGGIA